MIPNFYKLLKSKLKEVLPDLKQVERFKNQYYIPEHYPIFGAAVFVELGTIPWQDVGNGSQEGVATITLHHCREFLLPEGDLSAGTWTAEDYDLRVLESNQVLHKGMHLWSAKTEEGERLSSEFTRTSCTEVTDVTGMDVIKHVYRATLYDDSTNRDRNKTLTNIEFLTLRKKEEPDE